MPRRTGIPTILWTAQELCRLINKFTPTIKRLYPDNTALHAALAAANAACAVLVEEASEEREYGD